MMLLRGRDCSKPFDDSNGFCHVVVVVVVVVGLVHVFFSSPCFSYVFSSRSSIVSFIFFCTFSFPSVISKCWFRKSESNRKSKVTRLNLSQASRLDLAHVECHGWGLWSSEWHSLGCLVDTGWHCYTGHVPQCMFGARQWRHHNTCILYVHMSVDLKVPVLSVVCDDLWYAKMTLGEI